MSIPLIGITAADRDEEVVASPWYEESYSVPAQYVDAVRRGGGHPLLLPPGESDWGRWLDLLDGFVVSGGADVAPELYGGDPNHPNQQAAHPDRDETELALVRSLVKGDRPALFVCRGMQLLNVAMGGTLIQHLAGTLANDLHRDIHRLAGTGWAYHDVGVKPGSLLAKAVDADTVSGASGHHQAVDRLARGLDAVAWAADGVIEAVEVPGPTWLVGIQWHPEVTADIDSSQQGLFDDLVTAARSR